MLDVPAQIKNDYGKLIAKRGIPLHSLNNSLAKAQSRKEITNDCYYLR